jgi:antitoxin HicB
VAAKAALLNARLTTRMRPADLARTMGIKPQELTRIFDLGHATKIDTVAAALAAMGYELELPVTPGK